MTQSYEELKKVLDKCREYIDYARELNSSPEQIASTTICALLNIAGFSYDDMRECCERAISVHTVVKETFSAEVKEVN